MMASLCPSRASSLLLLYLCLCLLVAKVYALDCSAGYYFNATSPTSCSACAAGKANAQDAATTSAACIACSSGKYSTTASTACTSCGPQTFASNGACTFYSCSPGVGTATSTGATGCTQVAPSSTENTSSSSYTTSLKDLFIFFVISTCLLLLYLAYQQYLKSLGIRATDCYLMHDFNDPQTHKIVCSIRDELVGKGLSVWIETPSRHKNEFGQVKKTYRKPEGLESTKVAVAFINGDYLQKVNANQNSYVQYEFKFALTLVGGRLMLPVLLDGSLWNSRNWKGELGGALGTHLYINMSDTSSEDAFKAKCSELYEAIVGTRDEKFYITSQCFLSHNWAKDSLGRNNHTRVSKINTYLKSKNVKTWFDEEKMIGDIRHMMTHGIENTNIVIVFITDIYRNKVNGVEQRDNCAYEFKHSSEQLGAQNMIAVVMEKEMLDSHKWGGKLGAALAGSDYIDMTSDDPSIFEAKCEELHQKMSALLATQAKTNFRTSAAKRSASLTKDALRAVSGESESELRMSTIESEKSGSAGGGEEGEREVKGAQAESNRSPLHASNV